MYEIEFRLHARDGCYRWILSRGKVVEREPSGRPTRAVGTHTDITARKVLELELKRAKEQADAANQAKSTFLASVSHEIRTPLNAITGYAHLLQGSVMAPDDLDTLDKINRASEHLLRLLNDVLDLSKIEAGKLALVRGPLTLARVLDDAVVMMRARFDAKGLSLTYDIEPRLSGLQLVGDATRLGQVLVNYLSNALRFTDRGGAVVRITCVQQDDGNLTVRCAVSDTGIGISEANQALLFEPFVQVDGGARRHSGGSGLGLAISRRLAQLMGGDTGVSSVVGQGSTFWFTARLETGEPQPAIKAAPSPMRIRRGARILVVEDNEMNQTLLREMLRRWDAVVEVASHGGAAVEMVSREAYDLVLMDMQMPVMDGLEATRRIRATEKGRELPIVAVTANVFGEDEERGRAAGMSGYIVKPIRPVQLEEALTRWIPEGGAAAVKVSGEGASITAL